MISDQLKDTLVDEILKGLIGHGMEGLKPILELLFNGAMKMEREQFLRAGSHERTEDRKGYANGYKPKGLQTRLGALDLQIPQVRGLGFYPQSLEKGTRSEKALKLAIAQQFRNRPIGEVCYLIIDAIYLKVRHNGSVIDMAILLGYGITPEGKREILGASASLSEAEVHWREFFKHLQSRGMRGLQ